MQHLKPYEGGYRYRSAEVGVDVFTVEVQYWKDRGVRGIYAYARFSELKAPDPQTGFSSEVFSVFGGKPTFRTTLLQRADRKSAKLEAAVAAKLDVIIPELEALCVAGEVDAATAKVKGIAVKALVDELAVKALVDGAIARGGGRS